MEDKSMSEKLNDMIKQSLSSIKDMVSCDTIMGTPMHMPQGTTIIPISKVTVGYASGGLDYFSKNLPAEKENAPWQHVRWPLERPVFVSGS